MDRQATPATTVMARYSQNSFVARPHSLLQPSRSGPVLRGSVEESRPGGFNDSKCCPASLIVASPDNPVILLHRRNTFVAVGAPYEAGAHQRQMLRRIRAG